MFEGNASTVSTVIAIFHSGEVLAEAEMCENSALLDEETPVVIVNAKNNTDGDFTGVKGLGKICRTLIILLATLPCR